MSSDKKHKTSGSSSTTDDVSIYWFRNALRFHDNPSFLDASKKSKTLLPLCIIDPDAPFAQTKNQRAGCIRANFTLEALHELDTKIRKMNKESKLIVVLGKAVDILPEIVCKINASALYYEREPAAPIREADGYVLESIQQSTKKGGNKQKCDIKGYDTHTLHPMEHYLAHCEDYTAPSSYRSFTKVFDKLRPVPDEVETVTSIPPLPKTVDEVYEKFKSNDSGNKDSQFGVPTLERLGYSKSDLKNRSKGGIDFDGGEDAGLQLLDKMMKRKEWVCTFEKPQTKPNALSVDTTGLSPYVKHGCISIRHFFHELAKVYDDSSANNLSKPPVSLHGQLMWREYNYLMGYTTPNFDKMEDNPIARQIPWDDNSKMLQAWKNSQTGYPFIDAIMTQLRETGWIHHLARHAVACFLTRGDLWQSWEQGAAIFEEELIDADWSVNNFNWQWLSCTAHFYQYFRCYSPVSFGKKTDKNGDYIRKWLPQFKDFPSKYIYEPWTAPKEVQKKAGIIIGNDYPEPIVDHKTVSKENMGKMKEAYDAAKAEESSGYNASRSRQSRPRGGESASKKSKSSNN